jgi:protein O-mannosyl-transferase
MDIVEKYIKNRTIQLIIIVLCVFALYWQTTGFDFVLDDEMFITQNKYVTKGVDGLKEIFTKDSMAGYLGDNPNLLTGGRYRPLSLALFALVHQMFGLNKFVFHLLNVLIYALCCAVTLTVLNNLFKKSNAFVAIQPAIFIGTLLFAIHPVHTEVVANVKGMDEILSFLFMMTGFLAVLKYHETSKSIFLITGLISLFLSFMAKESSLPVVVIIPLGLIFFKGIELRKGFRLFLLMMIPAFVYLIVRYESLGFFISNEVKNLGIMNNPYLEASFPEKLGTIAWTMLLYLKLLVFPHPLTHDYYPWQIPLLKIFSPLSLISFAVIGFLIYLAVRQFKNRTLLSFIILYFFISISIVSNLVINVGTLMNERFLFIPSVAFSFFIIWGYEKLNHLKVKWLFITLALFFLAGFTFKSTERIPDWKTIKKLDSVDVAISKNSARINTFYAVNLFDEIRAEKDTVVKSAKIAEGLKYINRSLEIYPQYGDGLKMKAGYAAEKFGIDNNLSALLKTFTEVIKIKDEPYVLEYTAWLLPRADRKTMADFCFKAGYSIYVVQKKDLGKGLSYLKYGYNADPGHKGNLFGLCVVNYLTRNYSESVKYGNQYLNLHGENADILWYTGKSMVNSGQPAGLSLIEKATGLNPELKNRK